MEPWSELDGGAPATGGERAVGAEPGPPTVAVPEWATDAALDEAFASWSPGPPCEAPAAEREMARLLGSVGQHRDQAPRPAPTGDDVLPPRRRRLLRRRR